jgi:hypothetical protein
MSVTTPAGVMGVGGAGWRAPRRHAAVGAAPASMRRRGGREYDPDGAFGSGSARAAPCRRRVVVVARSEVYGQTVSGGGALRIASNTHRRGVVVTSASASSSTRSQPSNHWWAPSQSGQIQTQQLSLAAAVAGCNRRRRRGGAGAGVVAAAEGAAAGDGGSVAAAPEPPSPPPSPRTSDGGKKIWSKISTAVNVCIVMTVVWFSLSSFLTASPQVGLDFSHCLPYVAVNDGPRDQSGTREWRQPEEGVW